MHMARYPGLRLRKARWYLRCYVPVDLVEFLGRGEVWRSLRTGDHALAVRRYRRARADLDQWFDAQRLRRDARERINGEVPRLVTEWFRAAEHRASHTDFELTGEPLQEALAETEQRLFELSGGEADEQVSAVVDQILISSGWPARQHSVGTIRTRHLTPDGELPPSIHALTRRALIEGARRRITRLQGQPAQPVDPAFRVQPVSPGQLTIGELLDRFDADYTPHLAFSKAVEYQALFRALRETWGDHKPVAEITRADCRAIRDLLAGLPPHATKKWPHLSLAQAADRARRECLPTLSIGTVNSYMAKLSSLFRWSIREELATRNPAEALQITQPMDPRDARRPFSIEQLKLIFAAAPYVPRDDSGATFWAPLISLFGGLRLGEIAQLQTEDVTTLDSVPVILVRPAPGGRLKTKAARRTVPVHPELVAIGFLDFVARQPGPQLFAELHRDHRGYLTDALQRRVNRQIERAGAKGDRQSFHSLRHVWRDACREGGVSRDAVLAMGGWKSGGTEELYGGGLRRSTLAREIAKVRYEGLDLSHLHVR
jgi:site-specific recombinase XerD